MQVIVGARKQAHLFAIVAIQRVNAILGIRHAVNGAVRIVGRLNWRILVHQIECDLCHEPLEWLAPETLANGPLFGQIAGVDVFVTARITLIQIVLVLVHPHFGHSLVILNVHAFGIDEK